MTDKDFSSVYTAVDVETPNRYGRSICSIGIVHVEPGAEPVCLHYLVNPEDEFDGINISIHGIHPEDVEREKTFPQVWEEISPWFSNGILLAHNATFDLSVIQRSLERYELLAPDMYYVCTLQKARRHISKGAFGNHKLDTLCEGLTLLLEQHHNALSDAYACGIPTRRRRRCKVRTKVFGTRGYRSHACDLYALDQVKGGYRHRRAGRAHSKKAETGSGSNGKSAGQMTSFQNKAGRADAPLFLLGRVNALIDAKFRVEMQLEVPFVSSKKFRIDFPKPFIISGFRAFLT